MEGAEAMTDFQFKAVIEMMKSIVLELKDPDKIIERLEQIQNEDFKKKKEPK